MPLFVPIAIGAAIAALAGYGGKKAYDGISAMRRAKEIGATAEQRHKDHVSELEGARDRLAERLRQTHEFRLETARGTLGRMVELLQTLERRAKIRTPQEFARAGVQPEQVRTFVAQYLEAGGTIKGTITAAGAGAGASAAATGLIGTFATASTGAAISGLSGAAAQSAILAWLGGGSLAVGGGGMALGSVVLGGIAVAPALAIGGFVLAAQGEKAVTNAEAYRSEVDQAVERIRALVAFHRKAEARVNELEDIIRKLDKRASAAIQDVFDIVDTFDEDNDSDIDRLRTAMILCRAVSDLLQTRVLDDDGQLDQASERVIAQYRNMVVEA